MLDWIGFQRLPSLQRTAAVGMLLVQVVALRLLMEVEGSALLAMTLALGSWLVPPRFLIPSRHLAMGYWGIVAWALVRYFIFTKEFEYDNSFVNSELAYEIAWGSILFGLWTLWSEAYRSRLPTWYLATSAVGLVFSADIRVNHSARQTVLMLVLVYFTLWAIYGACSRQIVARPRRGPRNYRLAVMAVVLVASVSSGWLASELLFRHESRLERVLTHWMTMADSPTGAPGFSGRGGLSDVSRWKSTEANLQALRIQSDVMPGYLRGQTFDLLIDDRWQNNLDSRSLLPLQREGISTPDPPFDYLYQLAPGDLNRAAVMEVWPVNVDTFGFCFTPRNSIGIATTSDAISMDEHGVVQRPPRDTMSPYLVYVNLSPDSVESVGDNYLQLSDYIEPEIFDLADELFRGATTTHERVQRVEEFFHKNFQYELGIHIPRWEDRLAYFLRERPPAHCEYFATAAAVLLRIAGVPTRYVTGFVAQEQNPVDGSWVARRRDAHAWAEAYDAERKAWVIVEATPPEGVPQVEENSGGRETFDALQFWFQRMRELLRAGGVRAFFVEISLPLLVLVGILLLGLGGWLAARLLRETRRLRSLAHQPLSRLMEERVHMDRCLARLGITRAAHETLTSFALRIEQSAALTQSERLAQWYRDYARLRFGGRNVDEATFERIRQSRRELTRKTKARQHAR